MKGEDVKTNGNTILITGGATGIGLAFTAKFVEHGNRVIICGRREEKLKEAQIKFPQINTRVCDVSSHSDRETLYEWIKEEYPDLNILVNNAGVQRAIEFKEGINALISGDSEIETNFAAPIYLTAQFMPLLLTQEEAAVINVSSGLRFRAIARMPIYCATKAGIHSFTESLREQLRDTRIEVFEVVPPRVATSLGREPDVISGGIPPSDMADALLLALKNNEFEIIVG
ncbi:MAG TPA: SDR family NAD(P)-dependent oxidoreductase [Dehalococcoidia bacterium]|nr:SDR family NAD(P)-dependent oxidoreductase [Dehalococcoidia bacterium]